MKRVEFEMHDEVGAKNEQINEEVFRAAVEMVQNLPKDGDVAISNVEKLEFYALFKQATFGRCNTPRPAIWKVVDRYKWDAWSSLSSLEPTNARNRYVHKLNDIMTRVLAGRSVSDLLQDKRWAHLRPVIEPRFELISRSLNGQSTTSDDATTTTTASSVSQEDEPNEPSESNLTNPSKQFGLSAPSENLLSDDDDYYTDAPGSPVILDATDLIPSTTQNDPVLNKLRSEMVTYVQATTQLISQQIQVLGRTLKKQNALIQRFLDVVSRSRSHNRWPFLLLMFIWPILVQLAIRYFFRQG